MVEVFITDVKDQRKAQMVLHRLHAAFTGYEANFDLDDRDRILRVSCSTGYVETYRIIGLLKELGCHVEILPDFIPAPQI